MIVLVPRFGRVACWLGLLFAASLQNALAAKPDWKPVSSEELAETTPRVEATAAAEVVFLRVHVDDREYPLQRTTTTYVRYKIFEPEKADQITRLTGIEFTGSHDRNELRARLISPDGRVQEFGKEAIKERPLVQTAKRAGFLGWLAGTNPGAKERFLAITGVERGAVLEYHSTRVDQFPPAIEFIFGQRESFPVRDFEYHADVLSDRRFFNRTFVSNQLNAKMTSDPKSKSVTVTASNLPMITMEPFGGPLTDHVLTVCNCYEQVQMYLSERSGKVPVPGMIEAKAGPWAPYATMVDWAARDRGYPTKRSLQLAAEITQTAKSDEEKAALIHGWVDREWQAFRVHRSASQRVRLPNSLDDVINWAKNGEKIFAAEDFLWLALSLCRSAGLTAHIVLLPNREFARFNPNAVSPVFLPHQAIAVRIGESWRFSSPHHSFSLPFNMLPWQQEGQEGLLAQSKKQEFISIPVSPATRTLLGTSGQLKLDADGTLHGKFVRRFVGQLAAPLRGELRASAEADRAELVKKKLGLDVKVAELTVTKIEGLEDPERPLDITCQLRWAGFAVRTKDRLIMRPMVFRAEAATPFSSEERKSPMFFPYRWQELDQLTIVLPPEYELESPMAPGPVPGEVLHYQVTMGVDEETHALRVRREFMSNISVVMAERYAAMRRFYDHVVSSDQHELVLRKKSATSAQ